MDHSLLLGGGSLKSLGLSSVLPYFASEHGFSQVQATLPPAKLIFGYLNFVLTFADSVPFLRMAFPVYRDTIIVNCKIISVYGWPLPVGIQVDERNNPLVMAVLIVRHGIMCRI